MLYHVLRVGLSCQSIEVVWLLSEYALPHPACQGAVKGAEGKASYRWLFTTGSSPKAVAQQIFLDVDPMRLG